jgi:putative NADPH-quinone reductase
MNLVLVLCHPRPGSFNHQLASKAREVLQNAGHTVIFHDLYAEGFDPVLTASELARHYSFDEEIQRHSSDLVEASGLIIFHPDWWGQPPALLKGWVDRVLRPGVAYEYEGEEFLRKKKEPLLGGKKGLVFCTSDAAEGQATQQLQRLWVDGILGFCGMEASCHVFPDAYNSDASARTAWMIHMEGMLRSWFPAERGVVTQDTNFAARK